MINEEVVEPDPYYSKAKAQFYGVIKGAVESHLGRSATKEDMKLVLILWDEGIKSNRLHYNKVELGVLETNIHCENEKYSVSLTFVPKSVVQ